MAEKDYYAILGISRNASQDEIRNAFRKKAREFHPEGQGASAPEYQKKFQEVVEAHDALRDPQKREAYDRQFVQTQGAFAQRSTLDDLLHELFASYGMAPGFGAPAPAIPENDPLLREERELIQATQRFLHAPRRTVLEDVMQGNELGARWSRYEEARQALQRPQSSDAVRENSLLSSHRQRLSEALKQEPIDPLVREFAQLAERANALRDMLNQAASEPRDAAWLEKVGPLHADLRGVHETIVALSRKATGERPLLHTRDERGNITYLTMQAFSQSVSHEVSGIGAYLSNVSRAMDTAHHQLELARSAAPSMNAAAEQAAPPPPMAASQAAEAPPSPAPASPSAASIPEPAPRPSRSAPVPPAAPAAKTPPAPAPAGLSAESAHAAVDAGIAILRARMATVRLDGQDRTIGGPGTSNETGKPHQGIGGTRGAPILALRDLGLTGPAAVAYEDTFAGRHYAVIGAFLPQEGADDGSGDGARAAGGFYGHAYQLPEGSSAQERAAMLEQLKARQQLTGWSHREKTAKGQHSGNFDVAPLPEGHSLLREAETIRREEVAPRAGLSHAQRDYATPFIPATVTFPALATAKAAPSPAPRPEPAPEPAGAAMAFPDVDAAAAAFVAALRHDFTLLPLGQGHAAQRQAAFDDMLRRAVEALPPPLAEAAEQAMRQAAAEFSARYPNSFEGVRIERGTGDMPAPAPEAWTPSHPNRAFFFEEGTLRPAAEALHAIMQAKESLAPQLLEDFHSYYFLQARRAQDAARQAEAAHAIHDAYVSDPHWFENTPMQRFQGETVPRAAAFFLSDAVAGPLPAPPAAAQEEPAPDTRLRDAFMDGDRLRAPAEALARMAALYPSPGREELLSLMQAYERAYHPGRDTPGALQARQAMAALPETQPDWYQRVQDIPLSERHKIAHAVASFSQPAAAPAPVDPQRELIQTLESAPDRQAALDAFLARGTVKDPLTFLEDLRQSHAALLSGLQYRSAAFRIDDLGAAWQPAAPPSPEIEPPFYLRDDFVPSAPTPPAPAATRPSRFFDPAGKPLTAEESLRHVLEIDDLGQRKNALNLYYDYYAGDESARFEALEAAYNRDRDRFAGLIMPNGEDPAIYFEETVETPTLPKTTFQGEPPASPPPPAFDFDLNDDPFSASSPAAVAATPRPRPPVTLPVDDGGAAPTPRVARPAPPIAIDEPELEPELETQEAAAVAPQGYHRIQIDRMAHRVADAIHRNERKVDPDHTLQEMLRLIPEEVHEQVLSRLHQIDANLDRLHPDALDNDRTVGDYARWRRVGRVEGALTGGRNVFSGSDIGFRNDPEVAALRRTDFKRYEATRNAYRDAQGIVVLSGALQGLADNLAETHSAFHLLSGPVNTVNNLLNNAANLPGVKGATSTLSRIMDPLRGKRDYSHADFELLAKHCDLERLPYESIRLSPQALAQLHDLGVSHDRLEKAEVRLPGVRYEQKKLLGVIGVPGTGGPVNMNPLSGERIAMHRLPEGGVQRIAAMYDAILEMEDMLGADGKVARRNLLGRHEVDRLDFSHVKSLTRLERLVFEEKAGAYLKKLSTENPPLPDAAAHVAERTEGLCKVPVKREPFASSNPTQAFEAACLEAAAEAAREKPRVMALNATRFRDLRNVDLGKAILHLSESKEGREALAHLNLDGCKLNRPAQTDTLDHYRKHLADRGIEMNYTLDGQDRTRGLYYVASFTLGKMGNAFKRLPDALPHRVSNEESERRDAYKAAHDGNLKPEAQTKSEKRAPVLRKDLKEAALKAAAAMTNAGTQAGARQENGTAAPPPPGQPRSAATRTTP